MLVGLMETAPVSSIPIVKMELEYHIPSPPKGSCITCTTACDVHHSTAGMP